MVLVIKDYPYQNNFSLLVMIFFLKTQQRNDTKLTHYKIAGKSFT